MSAPTMTTGDASAPQRRCSPRRDLWAMRAAERVAAMRRGELSLVALCAWAARAPEEVPLLNGEFEFLAARTPEVAEQPGGQP